MLSQSFHDIGNGRTFLSYSYIDAIYGISFVVKFFLVDDGIDGDSRFAGLTVTDN